MATNIEWAQETWNPFRGCLKVSEGCKNCYAITTAHQLNTRFKNAGNEAARKVAAKYEGLTKVLTNGEKNWTGEVQVDYDTMMQPFKWKKGKRIFVNSMSDVFYEKISVADIAILFAVMFLTPQHTYMILTKRPERMNEVLNSSEFPAKVCVAVDMIRTFRSINHVTLCDDFGENEVKSIKDVMSEIKTAHSLRIDKTPIETFPFKNIWLGVSVENQATADERIPLLLSTPAHIRFLSMEPLLGEVDLSRVGDFEPKGLSTMKFNCLNAKWNQIKEGLGEWEEKYAKIKNKIDWVIVGGESGSKARPMNPLWVEHIQKCCEGASVPFFFKQWGEWSPNLPADNMKKLVDWAELAKRPNTQLRHCFLGRSNKIVVPDVKVRYDELLYRMYKIGKHLAGRLLNGKEYNEFPKT
jgi:protein gp37